MLSVTTEAETCRKYVVPRLVSAGWNKEPHSFTEQDSFTDGRIVVLADKVRRRPQKRTDYLLRFTNDLPIAVVEAKAGYKIAGNGLQQGKDYAELLDLKFVYSTNGHGIVEFDYLTGLETELERFPRPEELWSRLTSSLGPAPEKLEHLLAPSNVQVAKGARYYQQIAINRALRTILAGEKRVLLTMATGTGKTAVAFQLCWKLWTTRWNGTGEHRRPRILYLADRNILIDQPKDNMFGPFGDARWKIEREANKSREMYFATYQAIAQDDRRPGLYKEYPPNFFDLIIVDECHRGSANDESNWREILEYFEPAYQLGMTATPLREDNKDTYRYFGAPIYTYSLRQGIEDGFLAPYRVRRIVTDYDAAGYRPSKGDRDRYGREIPEGEYQTKDFERIIALRARTEAIARHLTDFLKATDRFAKTIVFCVDQEHADAMRRAVSNLNSDLVLRDPNYAVRITSDEGHIGRGHLSRFQELETATPAIVTTSQLLTTGVDVPTCQNIVLARVVGSMPEFKQIIGRGTRLRDDYGKYFFNILDYTGSATQMFADPAFDGDPALVIREEIDDHGQRQNEEIEVPPETEITIGAENLGSVIPVPEADTSEPVRRKYYVDEGSVEIVAQLAFELDMHGNQIRVTEYTDYAAERVRTLFPRAIDLRNSWASARGRSEVIDLLQAKGVEFDLLVEVSQQPDADPFDLLCHLAFNAPLRTRRERAERVRRAEKNFFAKFAPQAREILDELLEKYAVHGTTQFALPDVLKIPPISAHGNVKEIADRFGGTEELKRAVEDLQTLLYAA